MSNELPEFGLTEKNIAAQIRARMGAIVEYLPLITTNEQWQAILDRADPGMREDVRTLLEPMLPFQVPGGLPQEPEATRRIVYGAVGVLAEAAAEPVTDETGGVVE